MPYKKKLIEVALPLDAINAASSREKSIRHGHPSTLHLWWARRPLATARAVLFSSLVDDPSSNPEEFPTEEAQLKERKRLFGIIEELVKWENSNNERVLDMAKSEIMRSTGGNPPAVLDPFAGGGTIPLEAQRLGLRAYASDLNPVAVLINKAMIEIPPKFADMPPVNPEARAKLDAKTGWKGTAGLAQDVRYYGEWMRKEAFKRIGHLYPLVDLPKEYGGGKAIVIAWIWARTVKCPNPVCGCEMPLVHSFELSKKKGKEAYVCPHTNGKKISYTVMKGKGKEHEGTVNRTGTHCICCDQPVPFTYIREQGKAHKMSAHLIAIVAEGQNGRLYLSPNVLQIDNANVKMPNNYPDCELPFNPRDFKTPNYGLTHMSDLFTPRQITSLTTFSDLVVDAQQKAYRDAVTAGMPEDGIGIEAGGQGAKAYGEAIGLYMAFVVDKLADRGSTICSWDVTRDGLRNTFGRQAIPMIWDYAEANPFSESSGCYSNALAWIYKCILNLSPYTYGTVKQSDATQDNGLRDVLISTDPPYYDNIGYADLSDFFYVWLRRSLVKTFPSIFGTMLVPKSEELIATPYRFDGSVEKARDFFEDGMFKTFSQVREYTRDDVPVTIYYAFKQSETEDDEEDGKTVTASTGWETMLSAIVRAGFSITGTWPMRTEMGSRSLAYGTNALASSIVLVCRKREEDAPVATRRDFINTLKRELKPELAELQRSNIAPVDLAQAIIGPGMSVYSRYSRVLEADGNPMSVREALKIINKTVDEFSEQEGELDRDSRFCIGLYQQYGFDTMPFGMADELARSKNTSVQKLAESGVLSAEKGKVSLLSREVLPEVTDTKESMVWLLTQQLTCAFETGGVDTCAEIIIKIIGSGAEDARVLAYRLYTIAERKGWTDEAFAYNALVVAWPDIQKRAAELRDTTNEQITF